jgi:hypothetical protein
MKIDKVVLIGGTACLLIVIILSGNKNWYGALLGYWLSFLNSGLLYRSVDRSIQQATQIEANTYMLRGLFIRLGILSFVVVGLARFYKALIPSFIIGFAVGIMVSLIFIYRRHNTKRKG